MNRFAIARISLGLICLVLAACTAGEKDLLDAARKHLERSEPQSAIIQLKNVLQQNPKSGEARFLLAKALLLRGDAPSAVVEGERARQAGFSEDQVVPLLCEALVASGQSQKALASFKDTKLANDDAQADLLTSISVAQVATGDMPGSVATIDRALALRPKLGRAREMRARLLATKGAIPEALAEIDQVLAADPKRGDTVHLKGEILAAKGDVDGALVALRQAVGLNPRNFVARSSILRLLLRKRDIPAFREQIADMKKSLPDFLGTRYYEAQLAFVDGDLQKAREGVVFILRTNPDNVAALQLAGAIELQAGSFTVAETHLVKAIQISPDEPMARQLLARLYIRSGQPSKAVAVIKPIADKGALPSEFSALMGEAFLHLGDPTKAESYFSAAAQQNAGDVESRVAVALMQLAKGKVESGMAALEALATTDKQTYADMALFSARMKRKDFDGAMSAVDRLETKLPGKPMPHYLRSLAYQQKQDTEGAKKALEKALAADSNFVPAASALAALDFIAGNGKAAEQRFQSLLERNPSNARLMLALAGSKSRNGVPAADLESLLVRAVKAAQDDPLARLALVDNYLEQRRAKDAVLAAQEGISAISGDMSLVDALGRASLAAGDHQQAISAFGQVATGLPTSPSPQLRLGETYLMLKKTPSAEAHFRKALELAPKSIPAQRGLVRVALLNKRPTEALKVAREVQRDHPSLEIGYLLEAEIHAAQKDWPAAVTAYQAALQREPGSGTSVVLYDAMQRVKRPEAERFASGWLKDHPEDAVFAIFVGTRALQAKDYAGAETIFRNALATNPRHPLINNNLAWAIVQQKKAGAVPFAEKANELAPNQPVIMDTLASAYAAEGKVNEALALQRKVVERSPLPDFRFNFAKLLARSGDRTQAQRELTELSKLGDKYSKQDEVATLLKSL